MTDLLTPEEVKAELKAAESAASHEFAPKVRKAYRGIARLCRDYLTLWDRNKELERRCEGLKDIISGLMGVPKMTTHSGHRGGRA